MGTIDIDSIHTVGPTNAERRAAGIVVCHNARSRTEAEQLLDMLGLRGEGTYGCRVGGNPLPDWATIPKTGMRGTCSAGCRRASLGGGARR